MRKICFISLALFASLATGVGVAQTGEVGLSGGADRHEFNFRTLSPPGGFYYDGVEDVAQDGDGFVWVLLSNDLLRFDGYEYKRYYSEFNGEGSDSRLQFHSLVVDSGGALWVSAIQGLFRYDRLTDSFEKMLDRTYRIFLDGEDNIWVRVTGRMGIFRRGDSLDVKTFEGRDIPDVVATETDSDGSFLVATDSGKILRYDHSAGTFALFYAFPQGQRLLKIERAGDKLWVLLRNQGLASIDIPSRRLETVSDFPLSYGGRTIQLRDMLADKHGRIWIATQQGIWVFDPATGERRLYRHSEADLFSIPHNSVWTLSHGRDGNIWIGTFAGGLCMTDPDETRSFVTYVSQRSGLAHNTVSAFAEDDRALWIGTEGGGVNRLDKRTGEFTYPTPGTDTSLPANHIKSLVRDGENGLWIATYLGGLMRYDIGRGSFRYYSATEEGRGEGELLVNDLRKIIPEGDRGLWIAYQANRHVVSFLPYDGSALIHHYFDGESQQNFILDMCRSGEALWIVTEQKLYRMDVKDGSTVDISSTRFPFLNAQSVGVDAEGNVWVGTVEGTLIKYEVATGRFSTITGLAEHNASTVYSICFDEAGEVWMGTDNGLFRYDPKSGKFTRFDADDGAQGRMYNPLAAMKTASGRLMFGGTNGFSIVDPRTITVSTHRPRVIISGFIADNSFAVPRLGEEAPDTYYGREIMLDHRAASFGFRLASDNYASPSKNRFRYRLEGFDRQWMETDADSRTAIYSNVPPGVYRFEVSASEGGEAWGEPVSVKIVKRPAPWNSRAAWTLYFAVALTIIGVIVYYRAEKQRLAMKLYLDELDREKKEEIHQSQLRFFTNVSHDFRTPLSLIMGAVDNLQRAGVDERYYKILSGNSQRLLSLVNELMDFRTIESGKMQLQVEPSEINRLVREISADFTGFAREKNIDFRVECDGELSNLVYIDRSVVEKIVMNLLNNAFKYTPKGGAVTISTRACDHEFTSRHADSHRIAPEKEAARRFTIVVSDTGVGISKESISKVFERFYKVNTVNADSHLGTGIGLALVKSLVLLHRGAITIFSARDRGTDMVVELPADLSVYPPEVFRRESAPPPGDGRYIVADPGDQIDQIDRADDIDTAKSAAESMLMPTKKRILLAEDNDSLRTLISDFLSPDYEVVQAADGLIASEWLKGNEADLVISDIMMPGKDGIELCREVKDNIATSHIPFIILTAKTGIESKLEGTGSGADLYFEKPVDLKMLSLSVGNIFKGQERLREYYSKSYFARDGAVAQNERDNVFLKKLVDIIDRNLTEPILDVNFIASELSMNHTKLYSKVKAMTGRSIVEFILNYRMQKAARLILEHDTTIRQVMESVGIKSQAYFTNAFKREFGETPLAFAKSRRGSSAASR